MPHTVIETRRQQGRNAFDFVVSAVHAHFAGDDAPSYWPGRKRLPMH
jgi:hypothetical protein